ncbi:transposase domain protein [Shigella flexneri K-315]|uniref:Transposase domain protein n=1 Tax=Shigella flexneri K-315 TaxID=766150 RepID=I6D6S5_SHIFL|nr:transposase domain protein [Shigella flexneri K-315]EIQ65563.1 transposase domain protein [Shigella dysenteriae 225-75]
MPCFTAMRAEIALMSGSAFAVTHHAFSSGAGRTSDGNGSHASTLKSPSYTKSVSWQHYRWIRYLRRWQQWHSLAYHHPLCFSHECGKRRGVADRARKSQWTKRRHDARLG